ncbi:MAG: hypothetical protein NWF06_06020 [Candidatus Bathyarchaeota archaeon]|nr:hypothetical protein [Candidatus Bathyarchaeum sp.]
MQKHQTKMFSTIVLVLVMTTATIVASLPLVSAHDPALDIQTYPYLSISPSPTGVDQTVFLIFWLHGAPPTASGIGGDRWHDMTITINTPSGNTETLDGLTTDATGSGYTMYTPTEIGEYEFILDYPGQVLSLYNPYNGVAGSDSDYIGDNFLPSTTTVYLTVQEDPIEAIADYPLPTEYWTRPIEGQNTAWASIGSHWLRGAQVGSNMDFWQQVGDAPDSAHIMWTYEMEFGGVVGGVTEIYGVGFYSGGAYEGRLTNSMIISGKLYFQLPQNHVGGSRGIGAGFVCIDLQTGETEWINEDMGIATSTMKAQLYNYESMNQHGVVGGVIWEVSGTTWIGYDAWTGNNIYNLTNVPSGYEVYTDNGEIVRYVIDGENNWLALWNNTCEQQGLHGATGTGSSAYQWRPVGKEVDMSNAYSWNVTIPDLPGLASPSIIDVIPGDLILGMSTSSSFRDFLAADYTTVWALSDRDDGTRGQLLWIQDYPAPEGDVSRVIPTASQIDTVNRVFVMNDKETFAWWGYSIDTGDLVWGPVVATETAFSYYGGGYGAGQVGTMAYGNLYIQNYGGEIACINCANGNIEWVYDDTNSGVETPWGNYPTFIAAIADGKVYVFNNEHSPNYPLYKGEAMRCVDAYTGDEIWKLTSWVGQSGGGGVSTSALADGFLVYYNYYDNQVYCIGKGPSQTTVSAPNVGVSLGSSVLISGTVIDTASGTEQTEQAGRFPNGVPAVSDESMSAWMEYVYMQKPCPTNVNGVEVTLDAIDPNGNYISIGTVRSDASGLYSCQWTPEIEGKYTIIATFAGSNSYWGSYAETAIAVDPATATSTPIEPETPDTETPDTETPDTETPDTETPDTEQPTAETALISTEVAIIAAVAIAAVIGVAAFWTLRKRK